MIKLIIILFTIIINATAYFTMQQQHIIHKLFLNPKTPPSIKHKLKRVVFYNYLPWIKKQYSTFAHKNKNLLKYTYYNGITTKTNNNDELLQFAFIGFAKAMQRFNGNCSTITNYAHPFIIHELYRGVTISTYNSRITSICINNYKKEATLNDENKNRLEQIQKIINIINSPYITLSQKQLFYCRYERYTLKKIRTVRNVSFIMGFSEETYRKNMNEILDIIRQELSKFDNILLHKN